MEQVPNDAIALPPTGLVGEAFEGCDDAEGYDSDDEQYEDCFEDEDEMECGNVSNISAAVSSTMTTTDDDDQSDDAECYTYESDIDNSFDPDDYDAEDERVLEHNAVEYEVKNHAWWKKVFMRTVAGLDGNDETLNELHDWLGEVSGYSWKWTDDYLTLLGVSLVGNTHLESLTIRLDEENGGAELEVDTAHRDDEAEFAQGARSLAKGIAASHIQSLTLIGGYGPFRRLLFKEAGMTAPLEHLSSATLLPFPNFKLMITPLIPPSVVPLFQTWSRLTHLTLEKCRLGIADMQSLCVCMAANPWLEALSLKESQVTDTGVLLFCQHWSRKSPLQSLDLSRNYGITSRGAQILLRTTMHNPTLKKLDLSYAVGIGWDGLQMIGEQLPHLRLQHLDISYVVNREGEVPSAVCVALANGLRANNSLLSFYVGMNRLGFIGAQLMMQAVAAHPLLETFSLAYDKTIGLEGLKRIGQELPNVQLKVLFLDGIVPETLRDKPRSKLEREAQQAILNGMERNFLLRNLTLPYAEGSGTMYDVGYFLRVNGFRPLFTSSAMSPAVWPHAIAHTLPSYIFFILTEQPLLASNAGDERRA